MSTPFDELSVMHCAIVFKKEIRIARLKKLQAMKQADGARAFGALIGKKPNQISDLLNGRASFGEKVARGIEERASLPEGWLDQPLDGDGSFTLIWPLEKVIHPDDWLFLPDEVKADIRAAAEVVVKAHKRKAAARSGESIAFPLDPTPKMANGI